jgi:phage tail sheath protein FI
MAVAYATPGVYVEQVDKGTKPIEAAGTSITAFIGITAEASIKFADPVATKCASPFWASHFSLPTGPNTTTSLADSSKGQLCPMRFTATLTTAAVPVTSPACLALEEMPEPKSKPKSRATAKKAGDKDDDKDDSKVATARLSQNRPAIPSRLKISSATPPNAPASTAWKP